MKRYLYYIAFLLSIFTEGFAQAEFTVQGTVFSSKGVTVMGAEVSAAGKKTTTDAAGNFILNNVKAGSHSLTVFMTGFKKHSQKIKMNADLNLIIELDSLGKTLDEVT